MNAKISPVTLLAMLVLCSFSSVPVSADQAAIESESVAPSSGELIDWESVNSGGQDVQSPSHTMRYSVGQSVIGYTGNASNESGIGYWYGAGDCNCPHQSDYDKDGFLTPLDLAALIDVLFAGRPTERDPLCPTWRGDFDNDGFPTPLDLAGLIDHLFAGGERPCDPCNPDQSTCAE
jgi:hypothetical protein